MNNIFKTLLIMAIAISTGCSEPGKYDTVISNVRLFDGEQDRGIVNIGINQDSIAIITTDRLLYNNLADGKGKFVIPGLVNIHTHMTSTENVKEGFSHGILANLNMHTGNEDREKEWKQMSRDSANFPLLFGAGFAATVPGGHPSQFSPNMETISDSLSIEDWVDNRIANGADYIKIVRENHTYFNYPAQPTLSYAQIDSIIQYAHSKGYKVVVHAAEPDQFLEICKFKPDGFVHTQIYTSEVKLTETDWQMIKESGVFFSPNFMLDSKDLDDEDDFSKKWAAENLLATEDYIDFVKDIHNHGIMLLAGTDSPGGGLNFGSDLIEEIKFYKRAGLSNLEILKTATGNPAKVFDIPVGILKAGSKANLVLLNGNPLENLDNLREIERIWKSGIPD